VSEIVQDKAAERTKLRGQHLENTLRGVPQATVDVFRAQQATMAPRELLECYRHGPSWQQVLIETFAPLQVPVKPGAVPQTPRELHELLREMAQASREVLMRDGTRRSIPSTEEMEADARHIATATAQLPHLDPIAHDAQLVQRYGLPNLPEESFTQDELDAASVALVRGDIQ
jgi:hypothetical protein